MKDALIVAAGGAITIVRVMNLFASGEGSGPTAIGATPSTKRCTSATASVSPTSARQDGRPGRPAGSEGGEGGATSVDIRCGVGVCTEVQKGHLGTLPPVQPV